jgi:hypothetical protein
LENTVKQLGIDAEKIQFDDGEFKPFYWLIIFKGLPNLPTKSQSEWSN